MQDLHPAHVAVAGPLSDAALFARPVLTPGDPETSSASPSSARAGSKGPAPTMRTAFLGAFSGNVLAADQLKRAKATAERSRARWRKKHPGRAAAAEVGLLAMPPSAQVLPATPGPSGLGLRRRMHHDLDTTAEQLLQQQPLAAPPRISLVGCSTAFGIAPFHFEFRHRQLVAAASVLAEYTAQDQHRAAVVGKAQQAETDARDAHKNLRRMLSLTTTSTQLTGHSGATGGAGTPEREAKPGHLGAALLAVAGLPDPVSPRTRVRAARAAARKVPARFPPLPPASRGPMFGHLCSLFFPPLLLGPGDDADERASSDDEAAPVGTAEPNPRLQIRTPSSQRREPFAPVRPPLRWAEHMAWPRIAALRARWVWVVHDGRGWRRRQRKAALREKLGLGAPEEERRVSTPFTPTSTIAAEAVDEGPPTEEELAAFMDDTGHATPLWFVQKLCRWIFDARRNARRYARLHTQMRKLLPLTEAAADQPVVRIKKPSRRKDPLRPALGASVPAPASDDRSPTGKASPKARRGKRSVQTMPPGFAHLVNATVRPTDPASLAPRQLLRFRAFRDAVLPPSLWLDVEATVVKLAEPAPDGTPARPPPPLVVAMDTHFRRHTDRWALRRREACVTDPAVLHAIRALYHAAVAALPVRPVRRSSVSTGAASNADLDDAGDDAPGPESHAGASPADRDLAEPPQLESLGATLAEGATKEPGAGLGDGTGDVPAGSLLARTTFDGLHRALYHRLMPQRFVAAVQRSARQQRRDAKLPESKSPAPAPLTPGASSGVTFDRDDGPAALAQAFSDMVTDAARADWDYARDVAEAVGQAVAPNGGRSTPSASGHTPPATADAAPPPIAVGPVLHSVAVPRCEPRAARDALGWVVGDPVATAQLPETGLDEVGFVAGLVRALDVFDHCWADHPDTSIAPFAVTASQRAQSSAAAPGRTTPRTPRREGSRPGSVEPATPRRRGNVGGKQRRSRSTTVVPRGRQRSVLHVACLPSPAAYTSLVEGLHAVTFPASVRAAMQDCFVAMALMRGQPDASIAFAAPLATERSDAFAAALERCCRVEIVVDTPFPLDMPKPEAQSPASRGQQASRSGRAPSPQHSPTHDRRRPHRPSQVSQMNRLRVPRCEGCRAMLWFHQWRADRGALAELLPVGLIETPAAPAYHAGEFPAAVLLPGRPPQLSVSDGNVLVGRGAAVAMAATAATRAQAGAAEARSSVAVPKDPEGAVLCARCLVLHVAEVAVKHAAEAKELAAVAERELQEKRKAEREAHHRRGLRKQRREDQRRRRQQRLEEQRHRRDQRYQEYEERRRRFRQSSVMSTRSDLEPRSPSPSLPATSSDTVSLDSDEEAARAAGRKLHSREWAVVRGVVAQAVAAGGPRLRRVERRGSSSDSSSGSRPESSWGDEEAEEEEASEEWAEEAEEEETEEERPREASGDPSARTSAHTSRRTSLRSSLRRGSIVLPDDPDEDRRLYNGKRRATKEQIFARAATQEAERMDRHDEWETQHRRSAYEAAGLQPPEEAPPKVPRRGKRSTHASSEKPDHEPAEAAAEHSQTKRGRRGRRSKPGPAGTGGEETPGRSASDGAPSDRSPQSNAELEPKRRRKKLRAVGKDGRPRPTVPRGPAIRTLMRAMNHQTFDVEYAPRPNKAGQFSSGVRVTKTPESDGRDFTIGAAQTGLATGIHRSFRRFTADTGTGSSLDATRRRSGSTRLTPGGSRYVGRSGRGREDSLSTTDDEEGEEGEEPQLDLLDAVPEGADGSDFEELVFEESTDDGEGEEEEEGEEREAGDGNTAADPDAPLDAKAVGRRRKKPQRKTRVVRKFVAKKQKQAVFEDHMRKERRARRRHKRRAAEAREKKRRRKPGDGADDDDAMSFDEDEWNESWRGYSDGESSGGSGGHWGPMAGGVRSAQADIAAELAELLKASEAARQTAKDIASRKPLGKATPKAPAMMDASLLSGDPAAAAAAARTPFGTAQQPTPIAHYPLMAPGADAPPLTAASLRAVSSAASDEAVGAGAVGAWAAGVAGRSATQHGRSRTPSAPQTPTSPAGLAKVASGMLAVLQATGWASAKQSARAGLRVDPSASTASTASTTPSRSATPRSPTRHGPGAPTPGSTPSHRAAVVPSRGPTPDASLRPPQELRIPHLAAADDVSVASSSEVLRTGTDGRRGTAAFDGSASLSHSTATDVTAASRSTRSTRLDVAGVIAASPSAKQAQQVTGVGSPATSPRHGPKKTALTAQEMAMLPPALRSALAGQAAPARVPTPARLIEELEITGLDVGGDVMVPPMASLPPSQTGTRSTPARTPGASRGRQLDGGLTGARMATPALPPRETVGRGGAVVLLDEASCSDLAVAEDAQASDMSDASSEAYDVEHADGTAEAHILLRATALAAKAMRRLARAAQPDPPEGTLSADELRLALRQAELLPDLAPHYAVPARLTELFDPAPLTVLDDGSAAAQRLLARGRPALLGPIGATTADDARDFAASPRGKTKAMARQQAAMREERTRSSRRGQHGLGTATAVTTSHDAGRSDDEDEGPMTPRGEGLRYATAAVHRAVALLKQNAPSALDARAALAEFGGYATPALWKPLLSCAATAAEAFIPIALRSAAHGVLLPPPGFYAKGPGALKKMLSPRRGRGRDPVVLHRDALRLFLTARRGWVNAGVAAVGAYCAWHQLLLADVVVAAPTFGARFGAPGVFEAAAALWRGVAPAVGKGATSPRGAVAAGTAAAEPGVLRLMKAATHAAVLEARAAEVLREASLAADREAPALELSPAECLQLQSTAVMRRLAAYVRRVLCDAVTPGHEESADAALWALGRLALALFVLGPLREARAALLVSGYAPFDALTTLQRHGHILGPAVHSCAELVADAECALYGAGLAADVLQSLRSGGMAGAGDAFFGADTALPALDPNDLADIFFAIAREGRSGAGAVHDAWLVGMGVQLTLLCAAFDSAGAAAGPELSVSGAVSPVAFSPLERDLRAAHAASAPAPADAVSPRPRAMVLDAEVGDAAVDSAASWLGGLLGAGAATAATPKAVGGESGCSADARTAWAAAAALLTAPSHRLDVTYGSGGRGGAWQLRHTACATTVTLVALCEGTLQAGFAHPAAAGDDVLSHVSLLPPWALAAVGSAVRRHGKTWAADPAALLPPVLATPAAVAGIRLSAGAAPRLDGRVVLPFSLFAAAMAERRVVVDTDLRRCREVVRAQWQAQLRALAQSAREAHTSVASPGASLTPAAHAALVAAVKERLLAACANATARALFPHHADPVALPDSEPVPWGDHTVEGVKVSVQLSRRAYAAAQGHMVGPAQAAAAHSGASHARLRFALLPSGVDSDEEGEGGGEGEGGWTRWARDAVAELSQRAGTPGTFTGAVVFRKGRFRLATEVGTAVIPAGALASITDDDGGLPFAPGPEAAAATEALVTPPPLGLEGRPQTVEEHLSLLVGRGPRPAPRGRMFSHRESAFAGLHLPGRVALAPIGARGTEVGEAEAGAREADTTSDEGRPRRRSTVTVVFGPPREEVDAAEAAERREHTMRELLARYAPRRNGSIADVTTPQTAVPRKAPPREGPRRSDAFRTALERHVLRQREHVLDRIEAIADRNPAFAAYIVAGRRQLATMKGGPLEISGAGIAFPFAPAPTAQPPDGQAGEAKGTDAADAPLLATTGRTQHRATALLQRQRDAERYLALPGMVFAAFSPGSMKAAHGGTAPSLRPIVTPAPMTPLPAPAPIPAMGPGQRTAVQRRLAFEFRVMEVRRAMGPSEGRAAQEMVALGRALGSVPISRATPPGLYPPAPSTPPRAASAPPEEPAAQAPLSPERRRELLRDALALRGRREAVAKAARATVSGPLVSRMAPVPRLGGGRTPSLGRDRQRPLPTLMGRAPRQSPSPPPLARSAPVKHGAVPPLSLSAGAPAQRPPAQCQ